MPCSILAHGGQGGGSDGVSWMTSFLLYYFADARRTLQRLIGSYEGVLQLEVVFVACLWVSLNGHNTMVGIDGGKLPYLLLQALQTDGVAIHCQLSLGIQRHSHDVTVKDIGYLLLILWGRW